MSTITFDTLDATRRLRDAGFNEKQAEAVVRVLSDAQNQLVTREYLDAKLNMLEGKMESLELRLIIKLGAMMAVMSGIIIAVLSIR